MKASIFCPIFILFLAVAQAGFSQKNTDWRSLDTLLQQGQSAPVLTATEWALTDNSSPDEPRIEALWRRGAALLLAQQVERAYQTLQQAYDLMERCRCFDPNANTRGMLYYWKGMAHTYYSLKMGEAERLLKASLQIQNSRPDATRTQKSLGHSGLSIFYQFNGEPAKSATEAAIALDSFRLDSANHVKYIATCHNNIGNALTDLREDTALALPHLFTAKRLFEVLAKSEINPQSSQSWYSIGRCRIQAGNVGLETEQAFRNAIAHMTKLIGAEEHPLIASAYGYLGSLFFARKNFSLALKYAEKALAIGQKVLRPGYPDLAAYHKEAAQALEALARPAEAAARLDSALLGYGYRGDLAAAPQDFEYRFGILDVLATYIEHDEARYHRTGDPRDLAAALAHARQAVEAYFAIREAQLDDSSLMAFTDKAYAMLEPVLRVFLLADEQNLGQSLLAQAYQLAERLRAFVLLKAAVRARMGDGEHPPETAPLSVEQVQTELLRPGQTLLQYFAGERDLYLFVIGQNTFAVQKATLDFPLDEWVKQFRASITDYEGLPTLSPRRTVQRQRESYASYLYLGGSLYQKLLAPAADLLPAGGELVIVPDGPLALIPFEALLTTAPPSGVAPEPTDFRALPYLLNSHSVRYGWSAATLQEMAAPRPPCDSCAGKLVFVGFAPFIETRYLIKGKPEALLVNFRDAVNEISPLFQSLGGDHNGGAAKKKTFFEDAPCARYVFLGTHAWASSLYSNDSYIAFAPEFAGTNADLLCPREVYDRLKFPRAELVFLSACQTGEGAERRGEGILSFGRAFAFAGAKSVAFSLWKVLDKSSKDLSVQFFRSVVGGMPKAQALTEAKRQLVAGGQWAHPFYWSAFVLAGDGGAVQMH